MVSTIRGQPKWKTGADARPFKLPCLMKLEDLMQKFSGQLEINWRERSSHIRLGANTVISNGADGVKADRPVLRNGNRRHNDDANVTVRRDSRGSSSRASNSGDSLTEQPFRNRTPRRVNFKRTPKYRTIVTIDDDKDTSPAAVPVKQAEQSSRQATRAQPAKTTRSGKVRQQPVSKVDGQYVFGGCRVKSADNVIDTKNFVDEAMIVFLPEMCQRAGIDLVKDPMELCTKFSLCVPDVNLPRNEIVCIDMTGD